MMLSRYRANGALKRLEEALSSATSMNAADNFPEEFAQGKVLYEKASEEFKNESYSDSYESSLKGIEILSVIFGKPLPSRYVVQNLQRKKDCLWTIAGYDFIYNDPKAWKKIYEANKNKLRNSKNPDLIHPGLILDIPARPGEIRKGTWKDGMIIK